MPDCVPLCVLCFCAWNGVPLRTFERIKAAVNRGRQSWEGAPRGQQEGAEAKRLLIAAWMEGYAKRSGDFMPNKDNIHLGEFEWKPVFNKCIAELKEDFTLDHFHNVRRDYCKHIKLRSENQCGKCDQCTKLRKLYDESSGKQKAFYANEYKQHLQWKDDEKAVCSPMWLLVYTIIKPQDKMKCIEKAKRTGDNRKYVFLDMDGMDSSKTKVLKKVKNKFNYVLGATRCPGEQRIAVS